MNEHCTNVCVFATFVVCTHLTRRLGSKLYVYTFTGMLYAVLLYLSPCIMEHCSTRSGML